MFTKRFAGIGNTEGFFKVEAGKEGYYYLTCMYPNLGGIGGIEVTMYSPYENDVSENS